jgi:hypothetical protein
MHVTGHTLIIFYLLTCRIIISFIYSSESEAQTQILVLLASNPVAEKKKKKKHLKIQFNFFKKKDLNLEMELRKMLEYVILFSRFILFHILEYHTVFRRK